MNRENLEKLAAFLCIPGAIGVFNVILAVLALLAVVGYASWRVFHA